MGGGVLVGGLGGLRGLRARLVPPRGVSPPAPDTDWQDEDDPVQYDSEGDEVARAERRRPDQRPVPEDNFWDHRAGGWGEAPPDWGAREEHEAAGPGAEADGPATTLRWTP